jgi:hypothetical protein
VDPHRLAEERSLALHRAVLARIEGDPSVLDRARTNVKAMLAEGRSPHYARAWEEILAGPMSRLRDVLVADSEEARALRQATPFAGVVGARERWAIWRRVREQAGP